MQAQGRTKTRLTRPRGSGQIAHQPRAGTLHGPAATCHVRRRFHSLASFPSGCPLVDARPDQAQFVGRDGDVDPVPDRELAKDGCDVRLDGALPDEMGVGDLEVELAQGDELQSVDFSGDDGVDDL